MMETVAIVCFSVLLIAVTLVLAAISLTFVVWAIATIVELVKDFREG